ncbi:hypothetical protein Hanom_Chr06g00524921 [Helianthus anomalus]
MMMLLTMMLMTTTTTMTMTMMKTTLMMMMMLTLLTMKMHNRVLQKPVLARFIPLELKGDTLPLGCGQGRFWARQTRAGARGPKF